MQDLRQVLAEGIGRAAEHRSGLCKIALQEVRFSQHDADTELVVPGQRRGRAQKRREQIDRVGGLPALERGAGAGDHGLQRGVGHGRVYN